MGLPYSAIVGSLGSKKRVRYEDDDDNETLQPARRLQRRNAMRELRHAHGETVPLLIRSLNLGETSARRGSFTLRFPRPPSPHPPQRERPRSESSPAMANPMTDDEIRQLEEHYTNLRSSLNDMPPFAATSDTRNNNDTSTSDSIDDDLLNLRHALWQSAGAPPNASPSESPSSPMEQLIAPPRLARTRRQLFSSPVRPFIPPRPISNGPPNGQRRVSERARRTDSHSSIDARGFNFDRVLGQQGLRPFTNFESRGSNGRRLAGNNPNRHAIVVENPDSDYNATRLDSPLGDFPSDTDAVGAMERAFEDARLMRTGAVASMRAARVSSMAALRAMARERIREHGQNGRELPTELVRTEAEGDQIRQAYFNSIIRARTRPGERRGSEMLEQVGIEEEDGDEEDTFMLPFTAAPTANRPRLEEAAVPPDDEETEEAPEEDDQSEHIS